MTNETAPASAEEGRCHRCGEEILPVPTWGGILLWRCQGCWAMYRTDQVYPSGIPAHVWDALAGGCWEKRTMPLYEYRCDACGRTFEELRSSREADAPISCPSCESGRTGRMLSSFAASGGSSGSAKGGGGCGTRFTWA